MKLVSYNIQYGKGQDGRIDIDRIVDEIRGADVIALQEVDRFWPRSGMMDQVAQITNLLPDYYAVYGAGVDLHNNHPNCPKGQRRQFGNMVLSRYPIRSSRHHLLPKLGSIGPLSIQRSALEATIDSDGAGLRIYSVHLTHLSAQTRIPQIHHLLQIHQQAQRDGFPVNGNLQGFDWQDGVYNQQVPSHAIIMGDFNCQPDSMEYELMVGPKSDYGGRIINPTGFADAWTAMGNSESSGATSDVNDIPARLDYCFVSSEISATVLGCSVDEAAVGSDHFPVWLELAPTCS